MRAGTATSTADGRRSGEPLTSNMDPSPGARTGGLTAMFRSLASPPLRRCHSGALNIRLRPGMFKGMHGLERRAALLRGYLRVGGLQCQLTCADVNELRDARAHPERHRDLMVRITGYSAAFTDMTRLAREEIIRREEMG